MTIRIQCERCQKKYNAPDQYAGKKFRCKQCGATLEVPGLAPVPQGRVGPQTVPAGAAPVRGIPVQATPLQVVPVQVMPVQGVPVRGVPIQGVPIQGVPVQPAPGPIGASVGSGSLLDLLDDVGAAGPPLAAMAPLAAPAGFGPLAAPGRKMAPCRRARKRVKVAKQLWFALAGLGAFLVLVIACIVSPALMAMAGIGLVVLGGLACIVGAFWGLGTAFAEDVVCGLMYIFVPFYWLYYLASRWQEMKRPFLLYAAGILGLFAGIVFIGVAGDRSGSGSRSPPSRYGAPAYPFPEPFGR